MSKKMKLPKSNHTAVLLSSERGFTLVEALVAFLIFVVGILGAYKLQVMATGGNTLANRVSTSTQWAAFAVEEILGKEFDHDDLKDDGGNGLAGLNDTINTGTLVVQADGAIFIRTDGSKHAAASDDDLYRIFWNVAHNDNGTEPGVMNDVKRIRVRVFRHGGVGSGNLYNHDYYKAKWPESI